MEVHVSSSRSRWHAVVGTPPYVPGREVLQLRKADGHYLLSQTYFRACTTLDEP